MTPRRYLCLWLPHWPLQRLWRSRPELRQRPVILHARDARRGQTVVACSDQVAACGVRPQWPLVEALALWQPEGGRKGGKGRGGKRLTRQPHLEPYDPSADEGALQQLATWCQEHFSPRVAIDSTADMPESLLLDITGLQALFAGEGHLAQQLQQGCRQQGYWTRLAIADTIGAAWGLARFGGQVPQDLPTSTAPQMPTPAADDSIHIVPAHQTHAALDRLPLAALRLPAGMIATLQQLGIERIGQLSLLPRAALRSRFGQQILQRWDQALGSCPEVFIPYHPTPQLSASWSWEYPTGERQQLDLALRHLTAQLGQLLTQHQQGALQIQCTLTCAGGQTIQQLVDLFRPTSHGQQLYQLLALRLESLQLPDHLISVQLNSIVSVPQRDLQVALLDAPGLEAQRQWNSLINRLSSRLGPAAVVRPRWLKYADPQRACQYVPAVRTDITDIEKQATKRNRATADLASDDLDPHGLWRPLYLHTPPIPLKVIAESPLGPPQLFHGQQRTERVVRHWGPERLQTGWWRGRSVQRDYYQVETEQGSRYWLFQQLTDRQWFWHGWFV